MSKVFEFMSGRREYALDWKESMGSAFFTPPLTPSRYDEAEDSLLCNFHSTLGDPGRDALALGHVPEAFSDIGSFNGRMSTADESLLAAQPVAKKQRCTETPLGHLHRHPSPAAAIWKFEDEAFGAQYSPFQVNHLPREQSALQSYPPPATLPYGDPPRSFFSTISSLDTFPERPDFSFNQMPYMACHAQPFELFDHAFSSPSECETLTTERIPKLEPLEPVYNRSTRKPSRAVLNPRVIHYIFRIPYFCLLFLYLENSN